MKIVFNRQAVLSATAPLMCATAGKSPLPASKGIHIDAKEEGLCTLTTYDLVEKGVQTTIPAKVEEPGCFVINAQKFVQTMRVMDGEEVVLTVEPNNTATIECGRSSHKMMAQPGDVFPELPRLTSDRGFALTAGTLRDMLTKTMYAMAVNDQRNVLNGAYFEVENNNLLLVACDGFKLAKCRVETEVENHNEDGSDLRYRFIVPNRTVTELHKQLSVDADAVVRIHVTRKYIVFYIGEIIFFSRLIDSEYLDYDRIIIRQHKIFVTLKREELLSALERAALVTEENISNSKRAHVKLQLEDGVLKIMASSSVGSTYDEVEVEQEGDNLLISFTNRYLIDSVRACNSEEIRISFSSSYVSINIEPVDTDGGKREELFMLLPVRTKD